MFKLGLCITMHWLSEIISNESSFRYSHSGKVANYSYEERNTKALFSIRVMLSNATNRPT